MKKKYIIGYGAGGHAGVLIDTLQDNKEFKIIGLIDNIKKKKAHGFRILGNDNELGNIIKKGIKNVFFGIAGIKNVKRNIKLYNKLESLGFNIGLEESIDSSLYRSFTKDKWEDKTWLIFEHFMNLKPVNFTETFFYQFLNPKGVIVAIIAVSTYVESGNYFLNYSNKH